MQQRYAIKTCNTDLQYRYAIKIGNGYATHMQRYAAGMQQICNIYEINTCNKDPQQIFNRYATDMQYRYATDMQH